jgi:hypothetical protein
MGDVQVKYGDQARTYAGTLLAAARELELDVNVVVFSPEGYFTVPEEVADHVGYSYEVLGGDDEGEEAPLEPAGDDADAEPDLEPDEDEDVPEDEAEPEDEPLKGKALDAALEAAGLSKSGKVADKQARLAEYQNKE